ncbi:hypothetical protein ACJMK2_042652 [Sinanodonta woodiana]|uniref:Tartrate-resistant acid phosphatase type 5 n=1 Tax=Sinanodonta woodiana TaxID=1069815 RepID=A0ABD3W805_SINWO
MEKHLVLFVVVLFSFSVASAVDSLRFLVLGDWGGLPTIPYCTPVETNVARQMGSLTEKYDSKFNLALGDNFYFDGVTNDDDKRFQETFETVFKDQSLQNAWYVVAGNHDHNGNVSAQIAYSKKSTRWNFPNYYYLLSFAIPGSNAKVDIVMIDTVLLCGNTLHDFVDSQPQGPADNIVAEDQWNWIEKQLMNSTAEYLIVAGHFPVYSIAEHGPTQCLVDRLRPLLQKYQVTTYLSGHDHNLQYLQATEDGVTMDYFVIGAANFVDTSNEHAGDVPAGSSKFFWAKLTEFGGFAFAEATPSNMTITFVDGLGKPLYSHILYPRKI